MISIENRARLAFALVLFIGTIAGFVWYLRTSSQYITYQIVTHDSVSGLLTDAPVELHGVEVGKVQRVALTDPHSVSILLDINKAVPITTTTIATITSRGLAARGFTGYVYISLEDAGSNSPRLHTATRNLYPTIPTTPSRTLNLDNTVSRLDQNVQNLTDLFQSVLDKQTTASLKQSVDNLQKVTDMLVENNKKLNTIIANTEKASSQFRPLLESSNDTVRALQFQILPETYRTLDKMNRLSDTLNGFATTIERDPSIILRGSAPPTPGPGEIK